ncbi:hypothetical protein PghCCS26_45620 [Paenibacillus glycanilyticus]|uniref:Uncharacterized protein n=1 Tax=Paenibacillus glycanilyticus TaxID=126569 RepID=A0ABQ6NTI2_9BACL|nr:hypothetical protein PghCCS26_45620 [Paenibacillus glycanilyticus]
METAKYLGGSEEPSRVRDRNGIKEDAVNWGDPPLHGVIYSNPQRVVYESKRMKAGLRLL